LSIASFVAVYFSNQILTTSLARPPQLSKAKDVIMDRTNFGMHTTMNLIDNAFDNGFDNVFKVLAESKWNDLQEKGLAIFLFKNDTLTFWSENIEIDHVEEYSNRLVKVQNVWCLSYWIGRENVKGLLLVKVKYEYPYQNQFLKNEYHSSLAFLKGYSVSPISLNGSFPVSLFGYNAVFFLSYIPKDFDVQEENFLSILLRIGFLFLLIAIYLLFWFPLFRRRAKLSALLLLIVLVSIRILTLYWTLLPQGTWRLFSIEVFAYSWVFPSLGDLLLNTSIIFAIVCYIYRNIESFKSNNNTINRFWGLIFASLSIVILLLADDILTALVFNSTIALEAYRIFNLSIYTLLGYIAISLWFVTAILCIYCSLRSFEGIKRKRILTYWLITLAIALAAYWALGWLSSIYGVILSILVFIIILLYYKRIGVFKANGFLALIILISIYSVIIISNNADEKDREIRKVLAINLSNERDPVAEVIFPQIARKMHSDPEIIYYLENIEIKEGNLYAYLYDYYLNSYLKKYDIQITICLTSSLLFIEKTGETIRCYDFFEDMLNDYGERIPGTSFYHLNNQNGRISYLGMIEYVLPDGDEICIYLEFDSKLNREVLGYPELLLDGGISSRSALKEYSSAKYKNNQLIARTGDFNYPIVNHLPIDSVTRYNFITDQTHSHLIYSNENDIILLLSRPKVNLFNVTASFAWVFLFFYFSLILWLILGGLPVAFNIKTPSLKNRIKFSMVQLIILSLIMVGMVTIAYSVKSFENKNLDSLNEKLLSAIVDIEENIVAQDLIHYQEADYLTQYLIKLSNVLRSDINLYDKNGSLIATSRPEVFEKQLLGNEMHPIAWYEISKLNKPKLIHSEQIGNMKYLSAYAPLFNVQNENVAYLNLPYFTRQSEFILEIFAVVVALVNIYALLILFAIFVAVAISNQISKPLELIREKLSTVDITKHNEAINYEGNDELGKLVSEYNKMVVELAESAMKIVQSQRQSAWREMAKQIAHEIKNPLTPIKLNLQHLVRAKKNNQPGWEELFDRFAVSLIDQINALSNIATEFSNFAKMPVGQFSIIQINTVVEDSINLFSAYPNITIEKDIIKEPIYVYADKEQLTRVLVNLLKNAVQAIGRKENGQIKVSLNYIENHIRIAVEDNGPGISPEVQHKLFSPNFTTKSGGMGLGLAISKSIVEVIGGKIWFDTEFGIGTKFYVHLPSSNTNQQPNSTV
jgi:signal transduction histidine kinase